MDSLKKNLKKLKLRFLVRAQEERKVKAAKPIEFSFIYGIDPGGLSDFERDISGLELHETLEFEIESGRLRAYMGSLYGVLCHHLDLTESAAVRTFACELIAMTTPEPKEVVTAMAQLQKGGCGSSDCGCGCH